ncbi:unnamed protein product, partial [Dovyalis caffra]
MKECNESVNARLPPTRETQLSFLETCQYLSLFAEIFPEGIIRMKQGSGKKNDKGKMLEQT